MKLPEIMSVIRAFALFIGLFLAASGPLAAEEITLGRALEIFFRNNYDVIINRYEIDKSYGDFVAAKLIPNPNVSVNYTGFGSGWQRTENVQNIFRIEQLIETAGKRGHRITSAAESLEATRLSHKDTIRNLLTGFYTTYYNLALSRLNLDFADEELKRFDGVMEIGEKRHRAGFLSLIDFMKLKLARVDMENTRTAIASQYKNELESFRLLLGGESPYEPATTELKEDFPQFAEAGLLDAAYTNRYDLLALERQLKAAEASVSLAKAQRFPDVSVGAEYEQFGRHLESGRGVGIIVSIPLFYRNKGEILKKTAEYNQGKMQLEKTRKLIQVDVRQALNNYRAGLTIFEAYRTRKDEMDQLLGRTEKAFSAGGITVLDLLDTRRTYRDFATKYHQSITQLMLNRELIKVATGEMK